MLRRRNAKTLTMPCYQQTRSLNVASVSIILETNYTTVHNGVDFYERVYRYIIWNISSDIL